MIKMRIVIIIALVLLTACGNAEFGQRSVGKHRGDNIVGQNIQQNGSEQLVLHYEKIVKQVDDQLVERNQAFAIDIYRAIVDDGAEGNVFISPLSISLALAMTYNGADDETKEQMAQALQLAGMDANEINEGYLHLQQLMISADPEVKLAIANALWGRDGLVFQEDFMDVIQHYYDAEVHMLDFRDSEAASTINRWISDRTEGLIDNAIDGISEDTLLFLINAIYFKGMWSKPFEQSHTSDQPFYLSDGSVIQHPQMVQSGQYDYMDNDDFAAVKIPYGEEENLSMVVFLPHKDSSLQQLYDTLSQDNWNQWMTSFHSTEGTIRLPRFKVEYEITLNDVLQSLGMVHPFDSSKASFKSMVSPFAYIDSVRHQSVIEVNEVGTEAAAVTIVEVRVTGALTPTDYFNLTVDRPFFFTIIDEATNTIIFMGSVEQPE